MRWRWLDAGKQRMIFSDSRGNKMRKKLSEILFQSGYRLCRENFKEADVFYKYYQEGFHVVILVDLDRNSMFQAAGHRMLQEQVMELFYHPQGRLSDFPEGFPVYHVETLTVLIGGAEAQVREICQQERNVWAYQPKNGRLFIYENQPGNFSGLREQIENLEQKKMAKPKAGAFSVRKMPYVTAGIAVLNILVYLVLLCMGDTENAFFMASHGAMYPDFLIYNHQWWRILTAMFLHFGATHLINNMVMLCCIGSRLEQAVGHLKTLIIYLVSGIGGGILSFLAMWITGDYAVSAGASGAVFGVIGGLLWVVIRNKGNLQGVTTRGMALMIVLSLYYGYATAGVDNWAHLGGIITGFLAAMILCRRNQQNC